MCACYLSSPSMPFPGQTDPRLPPKQASKQDRGGVAGRGWAQPACCLLCLVSRAAGPLAAQLHRHRAAQQLEVHAEALQLAPHQAQRVVPVPVGLHHLPRLRGGGEQARGGRGDLGAHQPRRHVHHDADVAAPDGGLLVLQLAPGALQRAQQDVEQAGQVAARPDQPARDVHRGHVAQAGHEGRRLEERALQLAGQDCQQLRRARAAARLHGRAEPVAQRRDALDAAAAGRAGQLVRHGVEGGHIRGGERERDRGQLRRAVVGIALQPLQRQRPVAGKDRQAVRELQRRLRLERGAPAGVLRRHGARREPEEGAQDGGAARREGQLRQRGGAGGGVQQVLWAVGRRQDDDRQVRAMRAYGRQQRGRVRVVQQHHAVAAGRQRRRQLRRVGQVQHADADRRQQ
mmetsp:Transcript_23833/g.61889  ORF Transcript_23833/g.61889 Transcript_23833/m.61889 type:complete len:402 (+) Transcript_23833:103-1308(+)